MSTSRLYYTDSSLRSFDSTVVAVDAIDGRPAVVLAETAFYPTSGGQPFDTGTLGRARVVDVIDRDAETIAHVVEGDAPAVGESVHGEIAWTRRFDHMQQHTGQHVLSAAFERVCRARTTSFHLGAESSTIDLSREVKPAEIAEAVRAANEVVWDDRPVQVRFVSEGEAAALPLRKESARTGTLRLVEVPDFDLSACGGTHVSRTGVIGIIAVSTWERFKGGSRVSFVCGGRALREFDSLRDAAAGAMRLLSVGRHEVVETIERLQSELRARQRAVVRLQEQVAVQLAGELRAGAETIGPVRVVLREQPDWDQSALKTLASAIVAESGTIAVLAGDGSPRPVVAARSEDLAFDCNAFIKSATAEFGGRGGGRPELAQGGVAAEAGAIFAHARHAIASA